jgi:hypothetical protein
VAVNAPATLPPLPLDTRFSPTLPILTPDMMLMPDARLPLRTQFFEAEPNELRLPLPAEPTELRLGGRSDEEGEREAAAYGCGIVAGAAGGGNAGGVRRRGSVDHRRDFPFAPSPCKLPFAFPFIAGPTVADVPFPFPFPTLDARLLPPVCPVPVDTLCSLRPSASPSRCTLRPSCVRTDADPAVCTEPSLSSQSEPSRTNDPSRTLVRRTDGTPKLPAVPALPFACGCAYIPSGVLGLALPPPPPTLHPPALPGLPPALPGLPPALPGLPPALPGRPPALPGRPFALPFTSGANGE